MHAYYAETVADGVRQALRLIPEGSVVTMGGSTSVRESGLVEALKQGNYTFIDREEYADREEAHPQSLYGRLVPDQLQCRDRRRGDG